MADAEGNDRKRKKENNFAFQASGPKLSENRNIIQKLIQTKEHCVQMNSECVICLLS